MSNCEKLENFVQLSKSIEQSLELAKRGTEQIKSELALLKQIHDFHSEYDLLSNALKASPRTRSETVAFKKELFSLVRKRIHLLRAFHKHCEEFRTDMKSMRQLQSLNNLEYEIDDDENIYYEDSDDDNNAGAIALVTDESEDEESESDYVEENGIILRKTDSCTTFV